ncbi:RNA cap guanine-N2 methyltransferase-domain-containing protein [Paraphoma chrysanthemicola]|uniref:Trimethylguanosine synthase n=1 Tax=Paraphoma chrysanthemicola TaxID=798071 RepID=A0A8K0W4X0_9PLEO|nr:RNA cap guanine-N2 methyltransferase-domain-containing protein [Paraphoma chrysanthemicola]
MSSKPDEKGIDEWLYVDQFPEHLKKYWHQRYKIWEQYDKGIWMTEDAWFGVTPEPIANKIAAHIAESAPKEKTVIVDAFAGVGGNAIALARSGRWERVFAIEKDPKTMKCAKHNAEVYGVSSKIFWLTGDCFDAINRFSGNKNVVIFASPPWGGTEYGASNIFDLTKMEPYNLEKLYKSFTKYSDEVVLYLPRNSDLNQIARYAQDGKKLEVAHYTITGASKALCVYFGDFKFDVEEQEP